MRSTFQISLAALTLTTAAALGTTVFADDKAKSGKGMAMQHEGGSGELHESMMDSMQKMQDMSMTGNVDKDFAMMMIEHHKSAIAMAATLKEHGNNAELKAMADKMSAQQTKEIEQLKKFTK